MTHIRKSGALGHLWNTRLRLEQLEGRLVPAVLFVDDDRAQRKNAEFTSIQAAVDAASAGDTIVVYPGTYREQVTIGEGKDGLTLTSIRPGRAVIEAPDDLTGQGAIVDINAAQRVSILHFTITGPNTTDGALQYGVLIEGGASATVSDNHITDIRSDPLGGTQTGVGIFVASPDASAPNPFGIATIVDNVIDGYQKAGIAVFDPQSRVTIVGNVIRGSGPTAVIAQNGIQISDGAQANIIGNQITGNVFTPEGADASGLLIEDSGRVLVSGNSITRNEVGALVDGNTAGLTITGNDISRNTLDGISLTDSSDVTILGNNVDRNGRNGIFLSGTSDSQIILNSVTNNDDDGIHITDDSSGNLVSINTARRNGGFDLFDDTTGDGTAGTANTYQGNTFTDANIDLNSHNPGHGHHDDPHGHGHGQHGSGCNR